MYRVRWRGFPPSSDTWEPAKNLPSSIIKAFNKKQQQASKDRKNRSKKYCAIKVMF